MESALNGLSQMAILIIVAAVGFLAAKLDYLDEYTNQKLTKLLLNITLPCMIVASVHGLSAADAGETVGSRRHGDRHKGSCFCWSAGSW